MRVGTNPCFSERISSSHIRCSYSSPGGSFARWRGVESVSLDEWYEGLREHWADEVARLAPNTLWARTYRVEQRKECRDVQTHEG